MPVTNDESYYWVWSQNLQLSYYDHPPFVAWLLWLGEHVRIADGMVRWPAILLGQAALGIWLLLLKSYLTDQQRLIWLGLALLSPLMGGSGLIVTPDLPLMFFYALSLWAFLKWQKEPSSKSALILGLSVGFGFSSKYMMVLFVLSLLPMLAISAPLRRSFIRHFVLLSVGILVGSAPVWVWNLMHDFVSFKFQAAHGLGRKVWKPSWTIEYVLGQIGIIFPLVVYWAVKSRRRLPMEFSFLAWTPLLFFLFTTSRGYVEANWPIVAYPSIFALAAISYPQNRKSLLFTLALWGTLLAGLLSCIVLKPSWTEATKLREFYQFDQLAEQTRELAPLYARSYQMAGKLYFEQRRPIYKLRGMNRRDFFDYLEGSIPTDKRYFVAAEKTDELPAQYTLLGHHIVSRKPVDELFEIWTVEVP